MFACISIGVISFLQSSVVHRPFSSESRRRGRGLWTWSSPLPGLQLLHILDQVIPGHAHPLQNTDIESAFQSRRTAELDTSSHSRSPSLFRVDLGGRRIIKKQSQLSSMSGGTRGPVHYE